jgi:hypothetical protein
VLHNPHGHQFLACGREGHGYVPKLHSGRISASTIIVHSKILVEAL